MESPRARAEFAMPNASANSSAFSMQVATEEAENTGLAVLFHERPFKGVNGSGKHCKGSVGTDTGPNSFAQDRRLTHWSCLLRASPALLTGPRITTS
jgi:glutamine synthetase type III